MAFSNTVQKTLSPAFSTEKFAPEIQLPECETNMDWEPAESKNNNDHQDHFNNPLFVSNTLCGGMTTWGLGPQSAQHNGVHTADQ